MLLHFEHGANVLPHRSHGFRDVAIRVGLAKVERLGISHTVRHVTLKRVVRGSLIRQYVGNDVSAKELRKDIGTVAKKPNRPWLL